MKISFTHYPLSIVLCVAPFYIARYVQEAELSTIQQLRFCANKVTYLYSEIYISRTHNSSCLETRQTIGHVEHTASLSRDQHTAPVVQRDNTQVEQSATVVWVLDTQLEHNTPNVQTLDTQLEHNTPNVQTLDTQLEHTTPTGYSQKISQNQMHTFPKCDEC